MACASLGCSGRGARRRLRDDHAAGDGASADDRARRRRAGDIAERRVRSISPTRAQLALFEDRRARFVGDTITIVLEENTIGQQEIERRMPTAPAAPTLDSPDRQHGLPLQALPRHHVEAVLGAQVRRAAAMRPATTCSPGNLAVTVIEVLANGNLLVSGEKQVTINQGTEFIRFSGVINPVHTSLRQHRCPPRALPTRASSIAATATSTRRRPWAGCRACS